VGIADIDVGQRILKFVGESQPLKDPAPFIFRTGNPKSVRAVA